MFGGDYLKSSLLLLFNRFWDTEVIPADLIAANITVLFKKGDRSLCNNYRGISLLSIVGKVFADIILQRLHILAERVYAESQSGYRKGRSTIDGIFTLRQVMGKSREHQKDLHIAFIDFTKAFDCVNRELLFVILEKIGCPVKMTKIIKALYSNVKAKVVVDGELSGAFNYDGGVKQGCKLAPTLYGIYTAILLQLSFNNINSNHSVKVRFRYDGNLFDLWRLKARSKDKVYDQCIIPLLLYGSETWPLYQKHVKQLRTIQQRHLRSILSIKWDHFVSNEEVLERANVLDMEIKLLKNRLRWMGHICRMNDTRPVKALLFGELEGSRKVGRPLLRYKDTCKMALQRGKVLNEWIAVVNDRDKWKALIQDVCKEHNQKRKADYEERRQKRHKC